METKIVPNCAARIVGAADRNLVSVHGRSFFYAHIVMSIKRFFKKNGGDLSDFFSTAAKTSEDYSMFSFEEEGEVGSGGSLQLVNTQTTIVSFAPIASAIYLPNRWFSRLRDPEQTELAQQQHQ